MEEEYQDESIYGEEKREELIDEDALTPEEEAFMRGYEAANEDDDEDE